MAKTSAERQAAYRAKRAGKDSGERRLNTWVDRAVYLAIEKLASRYGITRRSVIELLITHEDGKLQELDTNGKLLPEVAAVAPTDRLVRNDSRSVAAQDKAPKHAQMGGLPRNEKSKKRGSKDAGVKEAKTVEVETQAVAATESVPTESVLKEVDLKETEAKQPEQKQPEPKVTSKKREKQNAPAAKSKPAPPQGAQFELEL